MADATHILVIAAAARRRLGALIGGDEGRALVVASTHLVSPAGEAAAGAARVVRSSTLQGWTRCAT